MSKSISPRLSLTTFRPNYSPKYNPKMHQSPFLSGSTKLKLPEDRTVSKSQPSGHGLSWSILKIPNAQCSKSVVRNWAARRVKAAFEEALRDGGLGRDGTALVMQRTAPELQNGEENVMSNNDGRRMNQQQQHNAQAKPIRTISGSLLLRVEAATVTATKETLDRDAETVVEWLQKQQQGQYGQGRAQPTKKPPHSGTRRPG